MYVTPGYAAGELPVSGVDSDVLAQKLRDRGHRTVATVADEDGLAQALRVEAQPGDMVVCLGAGDITKWAAGLPKALVA